MNEMLLPERARPAYRLSRWKRRLDDGAGALVSRGYSPVTVGKYLCHWVDFVQEYETDGVVLPDDVQGPEVTGYLDRHWAKRSYTYCCARVALRHLLTDFDAEIRCLRPARQLSTELFQEYVPAYLSFAVKHRGCRSSREVDRVLRTFFVWLESRGIDDISGLTTAEIRDFLARRDSLKRSTVALEASVLRCFLRYLGIKGVVRAQLAAAVESPRLYRMSSPPPTLDEETLERLLAAVDRTTALGKRDYAMLLLGARYGLRPSDVRGLCLDDIRWREQRIVILQSKTQRALELPLTADVDEALVDYLRSGRPACTAREVFVRHKVPIAPFVQTNNLWREMQRTFKAAGIEPPAGQHGFSLLRHTAATRMLARGVPFDTISDVLGHASVDTTRIYAQVDLDGLRSVALSAGEVCR